MTLRVASVSDESNDETLKAAARSEAVQDLILRHRENGRKLARSLLRRWRVRMSADEVDSVVDLTLCEAALRYCSERGASFMTFFFYHLRGHLVRTVASLAQNSNTYLNILSDVTADTREFVRSGDDGQSSHVVDPVGFGNRDIENPEHLILRKEEIERCRAACSRLDNLEREILTRSFADDEALVDIAKDLGYSRCHISRVKKTALRRLKGFVASQGLDFATELARKPSVLHGTLGSQRELPEKIRRRRSGVESPARRLTTKAAA